ncbi:DUF805 domain-containing protein [Ewingella americana]|uniref:DUF805 domain-containing protein n=1 Tax=Ewingella americana TaxID=41202 RepID=UPI00163A37CF|nr:DUF805 domain-containing protein [Ewingella americana]QMV51185.1 DUF805 domain-containing protein [Ewingella americana]
MTVWQCYLQGWKRYVDFSGRSTRKEFWVFLLGSMLISVLMGFSVAIITTLMGVTNAIFYGSLAQWIFLLAVIVPIMAVGIRRMHDINRSGWWFGMLYLIQLALRLINTILMHFAAPQVYVYAKLTLGILAWIPLLYVLYLCCLKTKAPVTEPGLVTP